MNARTEMGAGSSAEIIELPGGLLTGDGRWLRKVRVRPLDGRDEERLADRRGGGGAEEVSEFLASVVEAVVGLDREPSRDTIDQLPIGDRDYLLLRLRQMAIGDRVQQVLRCPSPRCGEKVDVDFSISEIPVRRLSERPESYGLTLGEPIEPGGAPPEVKFRLPLGADQVAIDGLAEAEPGRAMTALWSRILMAVGERSSIDEEKVRAFPLGARRRLNQALDEVVPGPDLDIEIACPYCGTDMTYPFDLYSFFLTSGA